LINFILLPHFLIKVRLNAPPAAALRLPDGKQVKRQAGVLAGFIFEFRYHMY
jgi:hypothetical protein